MKSARTVIACVCLWTAALAVVAGATQLTRLTTEDLGEYSDLVVSGKVLSVDSHWNASHTKIFTSVLVEAEETYKGEPRSIVEIVQLGGTVGNVKVTVQGALQWKPGEEVLLFVESYEGLTHQVLGLSQGKFAVKRDEKTGVAYVEVPPAEDGGLLGAPSPEGQVPAQVLERVPLERFVNQALGRR